MVFSLLVVLAVCAGLYLRVTELPWIQYCIFASSLASASDSEGVWCVQALHEESDVETFQKHGPSHQTGPGQTSEAAPQRIPEVLLSHWGTCSPKWRQLIFLSPKFLLKFPKGYKKQGQS